MIRRARAGAQRTKLILALIAIIAGSIDGLAALDPTIDVSHARRILEDALDRVPQD